MKDQVDALRQRGHAADMLGSMLSLDEKRATVQRIQDGITHILYIAPEQLNNETSRSLITAQPIALLAVDEAHCISEWGQAFRPDYLRLSHFADAIGAKRVLALTATATPAVARDMKRGFRIADADCVRTTFHRANLRLGCSVLREAERDAALLHRLRDEPSKPRGPTVVYATMQQTTERVASFLREEGGLPALAYHAGMPQDRRTQVQSAFMASSDAIIVATIAFGMGIDKADIRHVIHYNLPKSLEGYAQEIGRAGRDGLPAWCDLLAAPEDIPVLESFARTDTLDERAVAGILRDVFVGGGGDACAPGVVRELKLGEMARQHDVSEMTLRMLLAFVDIYHGHLETLTPKYDSYQLATVPMQSARLVPSLIHAAGGVRSAVKAALARECVCKQTWAHVDLTAACRKSKNKVSRAELSAALAVLEGEGALQLKASGVMHCYRVVSQPADLPALAAEELKRFQLREQRELARVGQVLALVTADTCQAQLLMRHFGEEDPAEGVAGGEEAATAADASRAAAGGGGGSSSSSFASSSASFASSSGCRIFASCGDGCERCRSGKALTMPATSGGARVDRDLWQQLASDTSLPRDSPRLLARFAFGFSSPRITAAKLKEHPLFGAFMGCDFEAVYGMCVALCGGGAP